MSLLKSTLESPSAAIPFSVRLEPYLVESICELSRMMRDKGNQNNNISGLLFGKVEAGSRTVEALKTFVEAGAHSELVRRERWEKAYKSTLEESKNDPELSAFEIVGWFSFRIGSGLLSSDVVFHNQHFRNPEDLALIVWREGPSQITAEVYSKSENDSLTSDDYRWGSVRLSADIRHMREPVELAMRVKLSDDSYLRTYDTGEQPSQLEILRRKAEAASERLLSFLYRRKEDNFNENIRGYIGDGRPQQRSTLGLENIDSAPPAQAYFSTDANGARNRTTTPIDPGPTPAPLPASWPSPTGATLGAATATARLPELASNTGSLDDGSEDSRLPAPIPHENAFDWGAVGRAPRTGRAAHSEVSGLPMVLRPPAVRKSFPWPWAFALFVTCFSLAFAFLVMGGLQNDGGRPAQVFHALFPGGELNLKVRNEDERLRLSWNQRNHAVASASDATLQITDGRQHRDVHLDGRQVADGSVLYRPLSNDVTFRLEVRGDQGATSGSVRVLDGLSSRQAVLDVSSPLSAVPAPTPTDLAAARLPGSDPALVPPTGSALPSAAPAATGAPLLAREGTPAATPGVPQQQNEAALVTPPLPDPTPLRGTTIVTPPPATAKPRSLRAGAATGGTTINGWDTPPVKRARSKQTTPVAPAVFPTVSSAPAATGYVPPRPLTQAMPNTQAIPNGTIKARTRVEVQVNVDVTGRVSAAHVVSVGVNDKLSAAALAAAQQWTFDPASNNGQRVVSLHTIVFEFRPEVR